MFGDCGTIFTVREQEPGALNINGPSVGAAALEMVVHWVLWLASACGWMHLRRVHRFKRSAEMGSLCETFTVFVVDGSHIHPSQQYQLSGRETFYGAGQGDSGLRGGEKCHTAALRRRPWDSCVTLKLCIYLQTTGAAINRCKVIWMLIIVRNISEKDKGRLRWIKSMWCNNKFYLIRKSGPSLVYLWIIDVFVKTEWENISSWDKEIDIFLRSWHRPSSNEQTHGIYIL